jgi:glycosyltransferase involved in cell wall biosynthesis
VKATVLIPIYEHKDEIGGVVDGLLPYGLPILIVDDGSGPATRRVLDALEAQHGAVTVHRRTRNGGRGAALKTGYRLAFERGFSHALQLDADGQHRASDVPAFLAAMESEPGALVLGAPVFDGTAPRHRLYGRQLSRFLVWLTTLSFDVDDPLCGFRGIPLAPTLLRLDRVATGDRMEFDPELVIRLHWAGVPVRNVATRVVYRQGGLSHFDMVRDNARLTWLYLRAVGGALHRLPGRALGRAGMTGAQSP